MCNGPRDAWGIRTRVLDENLILSFDAGVQTGFSDLEGAVALARLLHDEYQERGTNNNPRLTVDQSRRATRALVRVLDRLGVTFRPPFADFDEFYRYWADQGATGSWAARRAILDKLFNPLHDQLADYEARSLQGTLAAPMDRERTGWTRVDEELAELRRHFQVAQSPQDYRNVGNDCTIVLERLSEAAYDHARYGRDGEEEPPVTNTKARLERVVEVEMSGSGNAEFRKLARAAIEHAQAVKHRTPDRLHAGVAADSVVLVVAMMRRIVGRSVETD